MMLGALSGEHQPSVSGNIASPNPSCLRPLCAVHRMRTCVEHDPKKRVVRSSSNTLGIHLKQAEDPAKAARACCGMSPVQQERH